MTNFRRKRLSPSDSQVLFWLYEYTVKYGLSHLSALIEQIATVEQIQPAFQGSKSLVISVRHLQILFEKGLGKDTLRDLQLWIEDILKNPKFQELGNIYSILIKLYYTSKLLVLNNQKLNHDAVLKEIPYFNWNQLIHDFQLENDNFKAQFKTCIKSVHSAIQKSASQNEIKLVLDDGLLQECEFFLQINTEEVIGVLCKVLPETVVEKIAASKELCEELVQEENRAYTILIENINGGISQNAIKKIISLLTEEEEKFKEGLKNQYSIKTVTLSSSAISVNGCAEMDVRMDDSLLVTKHSDILPTKFADKTKKTESKEGNASFSPDDVQLSAGRSKIVKMKNPSENADLVVINLKIREINSKRWHPVTYCTPKVVGNSMSFEAAGNTKWSSASTLYDPLDLVVINSKVREIRSKNWYDINKPQDNRLSTSFQKTLEYCGSGYKTEAMCKDFIPVLINSKIREVKYKKWHPVCYSQLIADSSLNFSGSCNITEPRREYLEKYIAELESLLKQLKQKLGLINRQNYHVKPCEKHYSSKSVVNFLSAATIAPDGLRMIDKKGNKSRYSEQKTAAAKIRKAQIGSVIPGSQKLSVSKESKHDHDNSTLNLPEMFRLEQTSHSEKGNFEQNPDLARFSDTPTFKIKPLIEPIYNACGNADGTSMCIDVVENIHMKEDGITINEGSDSEIFHTASEFCSNSTYSTAVE